MRDDIYGRQVLTETDICEAFLRNPDLVIKNAISETEIKFDESLELENIPEISTFVELTKTVNGYDMTNQRNWYMPQEYLNFDIAKYVLDLCATEEELQRVGQELLLYQERDLFPLLRYCKYLVDVMRNNNIVWGVGRGSSVASYVLFLIGIHRINSLHYDLSIDEFLK